MSKDGLYYTFGDLERKLRKLRLPCSRMTLLKYEKNNVFVVPRRIRGKRDRIFTQEEFDSAIERIKSYKGV